MSTADAVARETAWLTSVDTLPALLTTASGPFENVQAYWPGARRAKMQTAVYVLCQRKLTPRFGGRRIMPGYSFLLKACWPIRATSKIAETEQFALDAAIDLLLQRVDGLPGDKSHGGRFLSVGETVHPPGGGYPEVAYADPEVTIPQGWLRADITYGADDFEIYG